MFFKYSWQNYASNSLSFFFSATAACHNFSYVPSRHGIVAKYHSDSKDQVRLPHYDINLQNQKKLSRSVVVRSELAGTGSPDVTFPLTGFFS